MRDHRDRAGKTEIHLAAHQRNGGGTGAFIRYVRRLKTRALLEHFQHQVIGGAGAPRGGIQFAGLFFCQHDKFFQRIDRQARMRDEELRIR